MEAMACKITAYPLHATHINNKRESILRGEWEKGIVGLNERYLLNASGIELAILDVVSELVEGFALLLHVLGIQHHLHSFFCSLHSSSSSSSLSLASTTTVNKMP